VVPLRSSSRSYYRCPDCKMRFWEYRDNTTQTQVVGVDQTDLPKGAETYATGS